VPEMRDYFVMSTQNIETQENHVCVYRRKKLVKTLSTDNNENPVLDIKVTDGYIYYISGGLSIERICLKEI
jgi:hypothetical protein